MKFGTGLRRGQDPEHRLPCAAGEGGQEGTGDPVPPLGTLLLTVHDGLVLGAPWCCLAVCLPRS